MAKTAEFIKLLSVLVLSALILGALAFFVPKIMELSEKTTQPNLDTYPQSSSAGYGEALSRRIVETLEKVAGTGTVKAYVVADISHDEESIEHNTVLPDSGVIKEHSKQFSTYAPRGLTEEKAVFDYSTKQRIQNKNTTFIRKQAITVLIDGYTTKNNGGTLYHPRSKNDLETYRVLVESLADFTPQRGDTLTLVNLPFVSKSDDMFLGLNKTLLIQSILLISFFILTVLILIRFIIPMIYALLQPSPVSVSHIAHTQPTSSPFDGFVGGSKRDIIKNVFKYKHNEALSVLKRWLYSDQQTDDKLSGLQKTAVLLLAIGEEYIKSTFLKLKSEEVVDISRTMAELGCIKGETVQMVFDAFLDILNGAGTVCGNTDYISDLVDNILPNDKKQTVLKNMTSNGKNIWEKLEQIQTDKLAGLLIEEYPQTIAVILYHLSNEKAGAVLDCFSESLTMDVLMRLTALQNVDSQILSGVEKGLEDKLQSLCTAQNIKTGKEKAAGIISLMDTKTDILNSLFERSPELAGQLSSKVIMFEDIATWDDNAIRTLLSKADKQTVVYALKGASDKVKEAFSRNMSPAVWGSILKETNKLTSIRLKEIDMAQYTLVRLAQELTEQKTGTTK